MEDEGVLSLQTFLVKDFPFHQPLRKQDDRCVYLVFKWVNLITDRRFSPAPWTFVKKIVMNKIILKMNLTFGTIGKARTDKLTEKLTTKTTFRFSVKKYLNNMQSHSEERLPNLVIFFCFQKGLFPSSWMKVCFYWTSCYVSFIWLPYFCEF